MAGQMLIGFNNDVEFNGRMFHIQTEDNGIKNGRITTTVFFSGQILDSKTVSYLEDIEGVEADAERKKKIKKRMVDLHREFYKRLFDGNYEEKVKLFDKSDKESSAPKKVPPPKPAAPAPAKPPSKSVGAGVSKSGAFKKVRRKSSSGMPKNPVSAAVPPAPPVKRAPVGRPSTSAPVKAGAPKPMPSKSAPPATAKKPAAKLVKALPSVIPVRPYPSKNLAYRGVIWPEKNLRIDGLVAEFLSK